MDATLAFIRELDVKVGQLSAERRSLTLRHLTDLFIVGGDQFSSGDIEIIDDIFIRLTETIEESARALLAIRLAPVAKAPPKVLRLLACDNAIDVASPVLRQAEKLDDATLVKCAMSKGQEHLLAIAQRKALSAIVTDVLVQRGDWQVLHRTARNTGAVFSKNGFGVLVERARGDGVLTNCVGARQDLPKQLLNVLLDDASDAVRMRLKAELSHAHYDVNFAVDDATALLRNYAAKDAPQLTSAEISVNSLNRLGQLNDGKLAELAKTRRINELVYALSLMSRAPSDAVFELVHAPDKEAFFLLTKAIGLSWETSWIIATSCNADLGFSAGDVATYKIAYQRMRQATAQAILKFRYARGGAIN
jgi:uncharacterized protein (DUF2336 family)